MDNSRDNSNARSIPGADLNGQDPATHTVPSLKRWLLCRRAPTKNLCLSTLVEAPLQSNQRFKKGTVCVVAGS